MCSKNFTWKLNASWKLPLPMPRKAWAQIVGDSAEIGRKRISTWSCNHRQYLIPREISCSYVKWIAMKLSWYEMGDYKVPYRAMLAEPYSALEIYRYCGWKLLERKNSGSPVGKQAGPWINLFHTGMVSLSETSHLHICCDFLFFSVSFPLLSLELKLFWGCFLELSTTWGSFLGSSSLEWEISVKLLIAEQVLQQCQLLFFSKIPSGIFPCSKSGHWLPSRQLVHW